MATFQSKVLLYATPSHSVESNTRKDILRTAEILKAYLRQQATALCVAAQGRPLLVAYSCDGTPLLTKERLMVRLRGKQVQRVGGRGDEYLVEQAFVRYMRDGVPETALLLRDPLRLTSGKTAWAIHQASRALCPQLEDLSEGICVYALCYDRALLSPLRRSWGERWSRRSTRRPSPAVAARPRWPPCVRGLWRAAAPATTRTTPCAGG